MLRTIFTGLLLFSFNSILFSQIRIASSETITDDTSLYVVGYAHLDTEWVWDYQTTINKYLPKTLKDNFALFNKYPDYIFNFSGANRYRMFSEYYPKDYELLKQYVKEGKWFPCGSSMEENDVIVPSPESTIRQILYGNSFFRKELGKDSREFMLPDCFGFPYSLPSVLAHCGLKGFSTQKLTWGSAIGIPFNIGKWTGPDGESVIAAFNPGSYTSSINGNLSENKYWHNRIVSNGEKNSVFTDYMYFGVGDRGGAPDEKSVEWLQKAVHSKGKIKVISATAEQMFMDITPEMKLKLPDYNGELLLTFHSAGSITSAAFMKRCNRKNELLAFTSEAGSVIADWLHGVDYPQSKLNEAWRLVLGAQFHDILPGTSIPRAYEFAWNDELLALNQFKHILSSSVASIVGAMDTRTDGIPVIVYNPLSVDRDDIVEANIQISGIVPKFIKVYNKDNQEVPSQILGINGSTVHLIFKATIPSIGFSLFEIKASAEMPVIQSKLKITTHSLENDFFIVNVNEKGDISGIYDKKANKEILIQPARLAFLHESPQEYPAWNMDWTDRKNSPIAYVDGKPKFRIIENGTLRITLEIEREARDSKFVQYISLSSSEGSGIEINNNIDWFSKGVSLKATFPLNVSNPNATYDCGLGTIQRGNNDSVKYEVPLQQWMDLTDVSGNYGVSIFSETKYGSDKPDNNTLRLTMLYTPATRKAYTNQSSQDFGMHQIAYTIYPHQFNWEKANTPIRAALFNQPSLAFQTTAHDGSLGKSFSFVHINNPDIMVKALKKAEDSDEIIIRVFETKGIASTNNEISFASDIISAKDVNGQEQFINDAMIKDSKLVFNITPYHPKTFAVKLAKPKQTLSEIRQLQLSLPFNADVISNDENKSDGSMNISGHTYPAEMLPESIICDGIGFQFGDKKVGQKNAVVCQGQKISLPAGNFNYLYIIAASSDKDTKGLFTLGRQVQNLNIQSWSGFIGQWDNRIWENYKPQEADYEFKNTSYLGLLPGYVKHDHVAYFTTHRHQADGSNEAYSYCYLYKYKIQIPAGAREIVLPMNPDIKIFAITSAFNQYEETIPITLLSDTLNISKEKYTRFRMSKKPVLTPASSIIENNIPIKILISSENTDEEFRYTLDGSEPTITSPIYTDKLSISTPCTIKATVFQNGQGRSYTTTEEYLFKIPSIKNLQSLKSGLNYGIYEGKWSNLPDFNKLKTISTGIKNSIDIKERVNTENFAFLYTGYINIPKDGVYSFFLTSDDGSRLVIDDKFIIDNDNLQGMTELSKRFPLEKGNHSIRIEYFENTGDEGLILEWMSTDFERKEIGKEYLFH